MMRIRRRSARRNRKARSRTAKVAYVFDDPVRQVSRLCRGRHGRDGAVPVVSRCLDGAAWSSQICGGLIVEGADRDGTVRVKYIYGPRPGGSFPWKLQRQIGTIQAGQLSFKDEDGGRFIFRLNGQNQLRGDFTSPSGGRLEAVLSRELASVP